MATVGCASLLLVTGPAAGLTCGPTKGYQDEAIQSGWPPDAPHEHVVIATIGDIRPIQGDSASWGEILHVRLDAVLRGDLPLDTSQIFNPPLGSSGWIPFRAGRQYLIAAHPPSEGTYGAVQTFLCSPNEEVTSVDQFNMLVSYADDPVLADTAMPHERHDLSLMGWFLVVASGLLYYLSGSGQFAEQALRRLSDRLRERRGVASG